VRRVVGDRFAVDILEIVRQVGYAPDASARAYGTWRSGFVAALARNRRAGGRGPQARAASPTPSPGGPRTTTPIARQGRKWPAAAPSGKFLRA